MARSTPIVTIDAGTFARTALKACDEGQMGFQNENDRRTGDCRYLYESGQRCAIGAGLPVEGAAALQQYVEDEDAVSASVGGLMMEGVLEVTSDVLQPKDLREKLGHIQVHHDNLMARHRSSAFDPVIQERKLLEGLRELAELHPVKEG